MIGNDVVDYSLAKKRKAAQDPRFLEKVFLSHEIDWILDHSESEFAVWQLWSFKEAAWKIWNRKTQLRKFNPKNFSLLVDSFDKNSSYCQLTCSNFKYYLQSKRIADSIHSIAGLDLNAFEALHFSVNEIDHSENASLKVRNNLIEHFIKTSNQAYSINSSGIPELQINGSSSIDYCLSLSHHGRFTAWAYLKNN